MASASFLLFLAPDLSEHKIGEVHVGVGLGSDCHPKAEKIVVTREINYRLDAVVAAVGAFFSYAKFAGVESHVVINHDQPLGGDFIEIQYIPHRFAGIVHKGLRLDKQHPHSVYNAVAVKRLEFELFDVAADFVGQSVDEHETDVVTGQLIFSPGFPSPTMT